jgi:hypothetical protein
MLPSLSVMLREIPLGQKIRDVGDGSVSFEPIRDVGDGSVSFEPISFRYLEYQCYHAGQFYSFTDFKTAEEFLKAFLAAGIEQ